MAAVCCWPFLIQHLRDGHWPARRAQLRALGVAHAKHSPRHCPRKRGELRVSCRAERLQGFAWNGSTGREKNSKAESYQVPLGASSLFKMGVSGLSGTPLGRLEPIVRPFWLGSCLLGGWQLGAAWGS